MDERLLLLAPGDNVLVLRGALEAGDTVALEEDRATVETRLGLGHKIARHGIPEGGRSVKYGAPIGTATEAIVPGAHVHIHNVKSDYTPTYALASSEEVPT